VCVPSFGTTDVRSAEWHAGIEQHGIDPHQVVDNLPRATHDGGDAQLDAAIGYLNGMMDRHPLSPPVRPPPAKLARSRFAL
jgi:hypothetical protein